MEGEGSSSSSGGPVLHVELDKVSRVVMHHLPCSIHHTGDAKVSNYFLIKPSTESDTPNVLESSFRGRLLKGVELKLPPTMQGMVIEKEESGEGWEPTGIFNKFTYWNHDTEPSIKDKPRQWIEEWPTIAAAIHDPISLEKRKSISTSKGESATTKEEGEKETVETKKEEEKTVEVDKTTTKEKEDEQSATETTTNVKKRKRRESSSGGAEETSTTINTEHKGEDTPSEDKKDGTEEKSKRRRVETSTEDN